MSKLEIVTLDVFAERKYAGNQLAVVLNAQDLSTEAMQAITLEMNYSETTFVVSRSENRAQVRIFTLRGELPFAGHPTIGTAWLLGQSKSEFTLDLKAGAVRVEFDRQTDICWMTPPEAELGEQVSDDVAAGIAGLHPEDLLKGMPNQLVNIGPCFLIVGVKDLAVLKRARLNVDALQSFQSEQHPDIALFLYSPEAYAEDAGYAARMLFNDAGLREDPATGSANTGFAKYLHLHKNQSFKTIVEQGYEIGRPSRIYLDIDATIKVGGKVFQVLQGQLV